MAENFRSIAEIINELLKGNNSALAKLAKVRMTRYEIGLFHEYGAPLNVISRAAKAYFSERFLKGKKINEAKKDEIKAGIKTLEYAINSCINRCTGLVEELNQAMVDKGFEPVQDITGFLDWLTFCYDEKKDYLGQTVYEPGFGFPIRIFFSDLNRKEFWLEIQTLMKSGRMMSIVKIAQLVNYKRHNSIKI